MRIGLIGAGTMSHAHTPGWQLLSEIGAELVGVVSKDTDSTAAFANQYGIKAYDAVDALISDVDIVDICVPTDLHKEMTLRVAAAGKHVICEKPIALNVADAEEMIRACEAAGVRLFIAHVVRYVAQYRAAKDVIEAGSIGKPGVIRLTRAGYQPRKETDNWFVEEARSGGMMLDLMVHDYDYVRWLVGDATRVFARSVRGKTPEALGDYALVTLRFESGTIAHIEGGWAYPPGFFRTSMDIAGTDGLIEWESDNVQTLYTHLANPPEVAAAAVAVPSMGAADSPFTTELRDFYEAIEQGRDALVTPQDALAALKIGLAAITSAKTGQPQEIV
jgi:myo-inositol 2-dehydrogenase/D-chiro-inositol 1-dehydrogenase